MQEGEDTNFLRFATALKILIGSSIAFQGLEKARTLLRDYLLNFSRLYGKDAMKPNHHWAVHVPDQVLDYGPLYSFWAFLTERLNKVLKNLNSNGWKGGLLEASMMREFHRTAQLDGMLNLILDETSGPQAPLLVQLEHKFLEILLSAGRNTATWGTIQDAAVHERSEARVYPGSIVSKAELIEDDVMRLGLLHYYNRKGPKVHLPRTNPPPGARTNMMAAYAEIYDFALLDGRRITSTTRSKGGTAKSALIQVTLNENTYVGEIQVIFRHEQPGIPDSKDILLIYVKWLKRSTLTPLNDNKFVWEDFEELGVDTWKCDVYAHPSDPNLDSPPFVIPLSEVQCQVARGRIKFTKPPIWITTTMDRYPTSLAAFGMGDAIEEE
ncbi:hypothetical protein C8R43DRAFT_1040902 [Mycena crocata]|nr:hypothetical protein C8R43DRAFT_1040902 [Mycena crocata]